MDVNRSRGRHIALKVLALDEANLQLAHDVLEVEVDRRSRCGDALAGGIEQVACLVAAECLGCLWRTLVGAHAEWLVFYAAHALYVWVVSVGIVAALVPVEGACGCQVLPSKVSASLFTRLPPISSGALASAT